MNLPSIYRCFLCNSILENLENGSHGEYECACGTNKRKYVVEYIEDNIRYIGFTLSRDYFKYKSNDIAVARFYFEQNIFLIEIGGRDYISVQIPEMDWSSRDLVFNKINSIINLLCFS